MASNKTSAYSNAVSCRYRQGDILRDVQVIEWGEILGDELILQERLLPYCIVLSQECDLEHDFNNRADVAKCERDTDKFLQSILLCPAYPAEQLRGGTHLQDAGLKMQKINSDEWKRVKQNSNYRYHFLPEQPDIQLPDLAVDFKQYLTIPREVAYRNVTRKKVLTSLDDLFREHLSGRFAHYLSRVGLPELESA
jgi:hypothetical protein